MKIGILGTGHIGKTLVRTLSAAGHDVKVANSRGPEAIEPALLEGGARAVSSAEVMTDVDVAILSVPLLVMPKIAHLVAGLPSGTVVIDTSNYYPGRDGQIEPIDAGQVESLWVVETLGRTVVKAWNAIGSDSLARLAAPAGSPDRIAIPVAGDSQADRDIARTLVDDTGFDAVDAGPLAESWRQQPGAPGYCTDLASDALIPALASARKELLPKRRDIAWTAVMERLESGGGTNPGADFLVRLNRALYM